ncbi:MAG: site-specific DNA-methyltransferase, partial [Chloroflexi bacterium]|nr:site-specific DNA-methyltransferase [Chloroflexota bacterium]
GDVVLDPFFGTGTTGAAARQLGRHWIGIEQDPGYIRLAEERIAALPESPPADVLHVPNPRREPRLPFGLLLENGLLQPGDVLTFGLDGQRTATVLADGCLLYEGERGSIHEIARRIQPGPVNGWNLWHYTDPQTGIRQPIDALRRKLRAALRQTGEPDGQGHTPKV